MCVCTCNAAPTASLRSHPPPPPYDSRSSSRAGTCRSGGGGRPTTGPPRQRVVRASSSEQCRRVPSEGVERGSSLPPTRVPPSARPCRVGVVPLRRRCGVCLALACPDRGSPLAPRAAAEYTSPPLGNPRLHARHVRFDLQITFSPIRPVFL